MVVVVCSSGREQRRGDHDGREALGQGRPGRQEDEVAAVVLHRARVRGGRDHPEPLLRRPRRKLLALAVGVLWCWCCFVYSPIDSPVDCPVVVVVGGGGSGVGSRHCWCWCCDAKVVLGSWKGGRGQDAVLHVAVERLVSTWLELSLGT